MKRPYANIWDWMERTGTNQAQIAAMTKIKRSFLSLILSRSRRCSLENALKLSAVSGVPVEKLFDKSTGDSAARSGAVSENEARKWL